MTTQYPVLGSGSTRTRGRFGGCTGDRTPEEERARLRERGGEAGVEVDVVGVVLVLDVEHL